MTESPRRPQSSNLTAGVWLKQKLLERQEARPSLSMRAFAKRLKFSPGHVANLISGTRPFTMQAAKKIAEQLDLSPAESEDFFSIVYSTAKPRKGKSLPKRQEVKAKLIDDDQFKLISDWYNF